MNECKKFSIPKKNGGYREILAPNEYLKSEQKKLLEKMYSLFSFPFAYGFLPKKGIVDNARVHLGKKFVLNIDIKDFFPSCLSKNLKNVPPLIKEKESVIYFHDKTRNVKYLPQGAPTSPLISNLFMKEADLVLYSCLRTQISDDIRYSRYADDITISSNSKAIFSKATLSIIKTILSKYGFQVNEKKIHKMYPSSKKEVTGIVINSGKPTISRKIRRNIRAAVHKLTTVGGTKEEFNKVKGLIAFVMQCNAHREWGTKMLEKLKELKND